MAKHCKCNGSRLRVDVVWKDMFKDASRFCCDDDFHVKNGLGFPELTRKAGNEPRSSDGCRDPPWICEELRRRELAPLRNEGTRPSYLPLLKDCAKNKDVYRGMLLHAEVMRRDLIPTNPYLGSAIVSMYAKCGMLAKAQSVLDEIPVRDSVAWNALITGYVDHELAHEALSCFESMQSEGLPPDAVTFICVLRACGRIGAIGKGERIHDEIVRRELLEKDVVLGTALVDMYARCGLLSRAHTVLKELPVRNAVSWNALIAGYSQRGRARDAIACFERMRGEGFRPDLVTYTCVLKACGSIGAIGQGKRIHEDITDKGLLLQGGDIVLGNSLVDLYAKCGELGVAHQVLGELPHRDVVSWNALISGYIGRGRSEEALGLCERMQCEATALDSVTLMCMSKACAAARCAEKGKRVYGRIVTGGFLEKEAVLGACLVDLYAKCGMLAEAQQVLEDLSSRNVVCWNALIAGYAHEGRDREALDCLQTMEGEGIAPDSVTLVCVLGSCGRTGSLARGEQMHERIESAGLLGSDVALGNSLVDMYAKCGELGRAEQVLLELPVRDVVSWNAFISGLVQHGRDREALEAAEKMRTSDGLAPDAATFACVLKSCGNLGAIDEGKRIHEAIARDGLLRAKQKNSTKPQRKQQEEADVGLADALVDMFARCGELSMAREALEAAPVRSAAAWCALISGHVRRGQCETALACFEQMRREGLVALDAVACICVLNACANAGDVDRGREIHAEIAAVGLLLAAGVAIGTALVGMYAKCGAVTDAEHVLRSLPKRDTVAWNALICACAHTGRCCEALRCFDRMLREEEEEGDPSVGPDAVTLVSALNACAGVGAVGRGRQIHAGIVVGGERLRPGGGDADLVLANALVDMYAKCGELAAARRVLEGLRARDAVTWNALVAGYAHRGLAREAVGCIECMEHEGLAPDEVTWLGALGACARRGLLHEARALFGSMPARCGTSPQLEHQTCLLLALGSAGHFDEAVSMVKAMPSSSAPAPAPAPAPASSNGGSPAVWLALLSACRKWANVKLGRLAFDQVMQLGGGASCAAAYLLMADIFSAAGMHRDAENAELMRLKHHARSPALAAELHY